MSFDLFAWNAPIPKSAVHAATLLAKSADVGLGVFEPGNALRDFRSALLAEYPSLEDFAGSEAERSPWAMTPTESDRLVEIHVRWGAEGSVLLQIVELALRHGIVLFDPHGPDVHAPRGVARGGNAKAPNAGQLPVDRGRWLAIMTVGLAVLLPVFLWLLMAGAARQAGP